MILFADGEERLDRFLARTLPEHSRSRLAEIARSGGVKVQGKVAKPSLMLEPGWKVELEEPAERPPHDLEPSSLPLHVVYEDDALLVVDKPRGLATHPATSLQEPSLVNALLGRRTTLSSGAAPFRPGIVHRLDKETTGLILVAKTDAAHAALARAIEAREVQRRYLAVALGELEQPRFRIEAPLARDPHNRLKMAPSPAGKHAVTIVVGVRRLDRGSLVVCRLETGRTHQIRVHLASIGHPVLGDRLYAPQEYRSGPMQLHAAWLAFDHPVSGSRLELFAAPPLDFGPSGLADEELRAALADGS